VGGEAVSGVERSGSVQPSMKLVDLDERSRCLYAWEEALERPPTRISAVIGVFDSARRRRP